MRVFKETTKDWSVPQANHTYIVDDKKEYLYGYVPAGRPAKEVRMLKNKIRFDWRYRTFKEIKG
jgi:hypothetical protein